MEPSGALMGLKILDFTSLLPGPFATLCLADLGADVLRISSQTRVDPINFTPPFLQGTTHSAVAAHLHRNKRVITLNLRCPDSVPIIRRLITSGGYDVVTEGFRPGVMDRLGLGYSALSPLTPRLIYCSLSGYGQSGLLSSRAGHDINYIALTGGASPPALPMVQTADLGSGAANLAIGLLAAAFHRERSGHGQRVDIAMADGIVAFHAMRGSGYLSTGQEKPDLLTGASVYGFYETADGQWIAFGGVEPKFWETFCRVVGRPEWVARGVFAGEDVRSKMRKIFRSKTREQWTKIFAAEDACVDPVLGLGEVLESQYVKDRQMVVDVPTQAGGTIRQIGCPIKLEGTPPAFRHTGRKSSDKETETILSQIGYSESEIRRFAKAGAIK
jgi:crotonobetainyl-CoA:carnitine CoA-transferase CaiB-like acyl-CoA transferase